MAYSHYYPSNNVKKTKVIFSFLHKAIFVEPKAKGENFKSIAEKLRQLEALSPDKGKKE